MLEFSTSGLSLSTHIYRTGGGLWLHDHFKGGGRGLTTEAESSLLCIGFILRTSLAKRLHLVLMMMMMVVLVVVGVMVIMMRVLETGDGLWMDGSKMLFVIRRFMNAGAENGVTFCR